MKTLSIKYEYITKTALLLTGERPYYNDVSGFQDSCFASKADSKLEDKKIYQTMLYQFCIANNAVKTRFDPYVV